MFASHSSSGGTSASCSNCAGVRLCFLSGTRYIVHPFFKHDNRFYHGREGDLFGALKFLQNKAFLIRLIAHSIAPAPMSERALVVRCAGVPVTNRNREEFKKSLDGFGSDVGNVHWNLEWFGFVKIRRPADSRLVSASRFLQC